MGTESWPCLKSRRTAAPALTRCCTLAMPIPVAALRGCQRMVEAGRTAGLHNRMRLQKPSLDHGDEVRFFVPMMRSNSKFGPRKLPVGRRDEQELPTRDQPVLALNPKGDEHGNPP